jgi:ferrous iron transport protein A
MSRWTSLDELKVGERAHVVKILGTGALKRRLMDMGLTKNTQVEIKKYAPLGDPIEINVRNYELTLRKKEANLIMVERVFEEC